MITKHALPQAHAASETRATEAGDYAAHLEAEVHAAQVHLSLCRYLSPLSLSVFLSLSLSLPLSISRQGL